MEPRISRWGIGPKIALGAGVYVALAAAASRLWPDVCRLRVVPYWILGPVGGVLCAVGVLIWLAGIRAAMTAYNSDVLVTSGIFSLVRHPIYAAWIVLILPGIALLCQSWPLLGAPLTAYVIFRCTIKKEDDYLTRRFGQAYLDYRARVNELLPWRSGHK